MKISRTVAIALLAACVALPGSGCGQQKEGGAHDSAKAEQGEDGHSPGPQPSSGAAFKAGTGIMLTDETRKILGIEVVPVTRRKLPRQPRRH